MNDYMDYIQTIISIEDFDEMYIENYQSYDDRYQGCPDYERYCKEWC